MPVDRLGQMVTFASEIDPDERYSTYVWVRITRKGETIRELAGRRGHPELAVQIAKLNGIRSVTQKLKRGKLIRLPGTLEQKLAFDAHFQDMRRPVIKDGYAIFDVEQRYGEKGITHFQGYNPIVMDIPILFEGWTSPRGTGGIIEQKIRTLERMAGRGPGFAGAASGPPAIVRVSCTDNRGNVVPLIPYSFQWNLQSTSSGILWRINGIEWDESTMLSDDDGNRVRASAVVHLWEYTPVTLLATASKRTKSKAATDTRGNPLLGAASG